MKKVELIPDKMSVEWSPEEDEAFNEMEKQSNLKSKQGVAEGAPELLKKEMPTHRHAEKLLAQNGVSKDDPDYYHHLNNTIKHLRQFGNIDLINKQGVAEEQLEETSPDAIAKREWVGLTDEEIEQGCKGSLVHLQAWQSAVWWAEAKLKEKNHAG